MYIVNDDIPLGCVYEGENGKTKYCPMLNHDDVPYCQYLEDNEAAIGIDERTVYYPIVEFPSADVQPVQRGHWINHPDDLFPEDSMIECSVCHEYEYATANDNFCGNCGADMRGEQNG